MKEKRLISIDRFRGFIVFCMCFFICAAEFPSLGILSRFANNSATTRIMLFNGMSLADLINPIFIFLISLSYQLSFNKRYKKDKNKAYYHFIFRYLIFMGLGSLMVSGEYFFSHNGKDPFIIMTILMFISFILIITNFAIKGIKNIPEKIKIIVSKSMYFILITLGLLGILLGIRDDIYLFFNIPTKLYKHWSILHEIGFTGLLGLIFIKMPLNKKIISWILLTIIYSSILLIPGAITKFDVIVLGGLLGTLGWLIVMLGGIIMINIYKEKERKCYLGTLLIILGISIILFAIMPTNTSAVTSNYTTFALFVAALIFLLLNLFNNVNIKYDYFAWWGKNPLPLFGIFLIIRLIEKIWNPLPDTNFLLAALYTFGSIGFLSFIAYYLNNKNIIIKI